MENFPSNAQQPIIKTQQEEVAQGGQQALQSPSSNPPVSRTPLIILGVIALIMILLVGAYLFMVFKDSSLSQSNPISKSNPLEKRDKDTATFQGSGVSQLKEKNKNIITLHRSKFQGTMPSVTQTVTFYSLDISSKQLNELPNLREINGVVKEAKVSPDGNKLYTISSTSLGAPNSVVTIYSNDGSKKEFNFEKTNLWTLTNRMSGTDDGCVWSPSGEKLACELTERDSEGAGTGKVSIIVLNYNNGDLSEVVNSDQIAPPIPLISNTGLKGWLTNDKILIVQDKGSLNPHNDPSPADFYTVNVDSKVLQKEFSYDYDGARALQISPDGKSIFFISTSYVNKVLSTTKLIKYDLLKKEEAIVNSFENYPSIEDIIVSEDKTKIAYSSITGPKLYVYELLTNKEEAVRISGFSLNALLPDNKTFVINKNPITFEIFNIETQQLENLDGEYVGLGRF